ncbi:hypothetical protein E2C01_062483 [Portunus trituberculatus]|uniref:Uncharacterized protein n=1 Tax=Portunus trituberculatus TaxID=210409 RepID=A0A5B7HFF6_PORTR|nr:hypothetical protein [Portunus trituberculatus]
MRNLDTRMLLYCTVPSILTTSLSHPLWSMKDLRIRLLSKPSSRRTTLAWWGTAPKMLLGSLCLPWWWLTTMWIM